MERYSHFRLDLVLPPEMDSKMSLSTGTMFLIAFGIVGLILLACWLISYYKKKK